MANAKVILADDHKMFRSGVRLVLETMEEVDIIGEVSNGKELIDLLKNDVVPDVILMDINMPEMNGVDASRLVMEMYPDMKILILSMYNDEQHYNRMIDIGVKGFILKEADTNELRNAVKHVIAGEAYFSQELLLGIIRKKTGEALPILTEREIEILQYICKGLYTQEIAKQLEISDRTVEKHKANIMEKTNTKNSAGLIIFAIKNNLVKI